MAMWHGSLERVGNMLWFPMDGWMSRLFAITTINARL